ncbi:MAG: XrtA system polysaccharide chain length determinant, partial [bacterium]
IILLGIVAGFAAGIGLVIGIDNIRDTVHSAESLRGFGLPVLATIPRIYTDEYKARQKRRDSYLLAVGGVYAVCMISLILFESIRIVS